MQTLSMQGRIGRRGAVLVAALALGLAGVLPAVADAEAAAAWDPNEPTPLSAPGLAVSLAQAGELGLWGDNTYSQATVPAELEGEAIKQVVRPDGLSTLALTAAGHVVGWGKNVDRLEQVPAAVSAAKVAQIANGPYGSGYAGAVTSDGRVIVWGRKRQTANPMNVPAGLTGVKQLVIGAYAAGAIKADGSVVTWGLLKGQAEPASYTATPPAGLKAAAIATNGANRWVALKENGALVTWGSPFSAGEVPASLKVAGSVKALVGNSNVFPVLLTNGKPRIVGQAVTYSALPDFVNTDTVLLASGSANYETAIVDRNRTIKYFSGYPDADTVPATFNGSNLVQIDIAHETASNFGDPQVPAGGVVITKMLRAELPQVSGDAVPGGTLTAIPGSFSASPESVTGQWLADGAEIPGETGSTLSVTTAQLGQQLSYRSTATKTGETTISSTSAAVKVLVPATVGLSVARGSYGNAATVTASVIGAAGNVSLTVDGKPVGTKALVAGKASFSTARTITPGNHAVKVTYAGGTSYGPGSKTGTLSVGKGRTGIPTLKVTKASPKKPGKVTVAVPTAVGLVKATGTAQLLLKKGRATKKVNLRVINGTATGKVPKLAKGTWTATLTYQGNTYYVAVKSRSIKVKSK